MPNLSRDFETRSTLNLKKVGAHQYSSHPDTDVWCCAYAVDNEPVKLWIPGDSIPLELIVAAQNTGWTVSAFNDQFERLIEQHIMGPRYGWPIIPIEKHRCSMAAALALALPGNLKKVAEVLGLEQRKDEAGHRNMMMLAKPRKPRKAEDPTQIYWHSDPARLKIQYVVYRTLKSSAPYKHASAASTPRNRRFGY